MDPTPDFDFDLNLDLAPADLPARRKPTGQTRKLLEHIGNDDYIFRIDWSSLSSYMECPRKALWHLVFSRGTYESPALVYGRAIHKALEEIYRGQSLTQALIAGESILTESPPPPGEWRDIRSFQNAIRKYCVEYVQESFDVVKVENPQTHDQSDAVELPFELPLGELKLDSIISFAPATLVIGQDSNPESSFYIRRIFIQWTGVVDLILQQPNGLWNMDHKTASRGGPAYFDGFEFSQQFVGYTWAARTLTGENIRGSILNMIFGRKPTKTGTALEFHRRAYDYDDYNITEWKLSILATVENFFNDLTKGFFPQFTTSCNSKYGTCPFHKICKLRSDEDQMVLAMSDEYAPNVWNPLVRE